MDPIIGVEQANELLQYGFGGFSLILLSLVYYMFKSLLDAFKQNTTAYIQLIGMLDARPCLHDDRALKKHE